MQEQARRQGPQLRKLEMARVAAEAAWTAAESRVQSLTASGTALQREDGQLTDV